ncbi:MAG: diguanylate cyclase [Acidimicrobiales bacterium]
MLLGWEHQAHGTTLSAGVALHEADHPSEETFERADRALYRAKAKGKNQAQLWRPGLTVDDAAS